jgi:hypothetical protein
MLGRSTVGQWTASTCWPRRPKPTVPRSATGLLAAYALGSLAHGGFSELVSDVDLGLLVSDPVQPEDAETIQAIAETEKHSGNSFDGSSLAHHSTPSQRRTAQHSTRSWLDV